MSQANAEIMGETVELSQQGAVLTVFMNRPHHHNTLNSKLITDLTATFQAVNLYDEIHVVILTGRGRSFCAGADLLEPDSSSKESLDQNIVTGESIFELMVALDECTKPVVGRVNGAAIGGGMGLVSCCDVVVAVDRAKFGFSEVRLGLVPAIISPFVLARISHHRVRELFLSGELFGVDVAQEIGLVHYVTAEEELDDKVDERVQQLLMGAPGAQSDAKKLISTVMYRPKEETRGYAVELFARRWKSDEAYEGRRAFIEKRKPAWQK